MSRSDSFMGLSDRARAHVRGMKREPYSHQAGYFDTAALYKYTDDNEVTYFEVEQRTEFYGGPIMYNTLATATEDGFCILKELSWTLDEIADTSGISKEFLLEDEDLEYWRTL